MRSWWLQWVVVAGRQVGFGAEIGNRDQEMKVASSIVDRPRTPS